MSATIDNNELAHYAMYANAGYGSLLYENADMDVL